MAISTAREITHTSYICDHVFRVKLHAEFGVTGHLNVRRRVGGLGFSDEGKKSQVIKPTVFWAEKFIPTMTEQRYMYLWDERGHAHSESTLRDDRKDIETTLCRDESKESHDKWQKDDSKSRSAVPLRHCVRRDNVRSRTKASCATPS